MQSDEIQVIVLGADHYNSLGVIRSLGIAGIKTFFCLLSNNKINPTAASKYIKKTYKFIENDWKSVLDFLINEFNYSVTTIIIPTGDPAAKFLDENYNILSTKYIIQNISNTQNRVTEMMSKDNQVKLSEKYNIKHANTWLVKLDSNYFPVINKKVIMKPCLSAEGDKGDILICEANEITNCLKSFKEKGYKEILVQEFIDVEKEVSFMGVCNSGQVIIPGIYEKINIYPNKRGNTSYAKMMPTEENKYDLIPFINMMKDLNYNGLFEIETLIFNNQMYFNELNLRNSANSFSYIGANVNYLKLYIDMVLDKKCESNIKVKSDYYFCIEPFLLKSVKEGQISLKEAKKRIANSFKLIYYSKDKKPFFMRLVNSVYMRMVGKI